jgi:hypothetical protein
MILTELLYSRGDSVCVHIQPFQCGDNILVRILGAACFDPQSDFLKSGGNSVLVED